MMGEFILYCRGKIAGGIYDNRLLVKPLPSAAALLPAAPRVKPYEGAKEMLLVEAVDDSAFLKELFANIADEAPAKGKRAHLPHPSEPNNRNPPAKPAGFSFSGTAPAAVHPLLS